jgi:hypothetical protein
VNQEFRLRAPEAVTDLMKPQCGRAHFQGALALGRETVVSPDQVR